MLKNSLLWPANRYFQPLGHSDFDNSRWPYLVAAGRVDRESRYKSWNLHQETTGKSTFFQARWFMPIRAALFLGWWTIARKLIFSCSFLPSDVPESTKVWPKPPGSDQDFGPLGLRQRWLVSNTELQTSQLCTFQWHRFKLNTWR